MLYSPCMSTQAVKRVRLGKGRKPPDNKRNSVCSVSRKAVSCCWLLEFFSSAVGSLQSCHGTGAVLSCKYHSRWDEIVCVCVCVVGIIVVLYGTGMALKFFFANIYLFLYVNGLGGGFHSKMRAHVVVWTFSTISWALFI